MKRWIFAVLALAAAVQAPAQPKVAVLDAVIPESMDEAVIIPVTDKIVEELVVSGKYTVLDRANIEQVLQEKEFQVSGLVKDTEIAKAGEYLGAAFVVIARVSRIEDTYFISARMIDVATGAIMAQTSDQEEGKISVLIAVAGRVGRKLAGGLIEEVTTPQPEEPPRERVVQGGAEAGPPVLSPPAVQMQAPEKPEGFSRFVVSFLYPLFEGDAAEGFDDLVDYYAGANCDTRGYGLDLHWMHFLSSYLYLGLSSAWAGLDCSDDLATENVFSFLDLQASAGFALPLGERFQGFLGFLAGLAYLKLGNFWAEEGSADGTFCFGAEFGADVRLSGSFVVSARAHYTNVRFDSETGDIFDPVWSTPVFTKSEPYLLEAIGLLVGVGYSY